MKHYLYVPFTGLGLYGGFRGNRWLKNRIQIFNQFVVPSLQKQTNQNFSIWVSWRRQERENKQVQNLKLLLVSIFGKERVIFTYHGVCFYDDKYEDEVAHERLITSLHHTIGDLIDDIGDVKNVLMTIQPSDDCYANNMVERIQSLATKKDSTYQAWGYSCGWIMNYQTKELRIYSPETHPPFFTIKFPKEIFIDPFKHATYTGPYKSHEYIGDKLRFESIHARGFIVGCHGENISTHFNHPYAGREFKHTLKVFDWIRTVQPLKIRYSIRKQLMRKLPHGWQRKLRYIFGEKLYAVFYKFIRG